MKSIAKLTIVGILLVILSPIIGLVGTVWSIFGSFDALVQNESAGIGAVGGQLQKALIFTVCGIIGMTIGILMVIVGLRNSKRH